MKILEKDYSKKRSRRKTIKVNYELHATPELRYVKRIVNPIIHPKERPLVLQQKHEIHRPTMVGDGFDGGDTWMEMRPTGEFEWKDVPTVTVE